MVLARIDGAPAGMKGVSLFLLPRTLPDGTANAYRIVRLKDKLGTRSMASGEIRLEGARAYLVGEAGRGFQQMADMVNNSRLCNGVRAAGLMRRAVQRGAVHRPRTPRLRPPADRHAADAPPAAQAAAAGRAGAHDGVPDGRGAAPRRCRRGRRLPAGAHPHAADQVPRLPRRAQGHRRRDGGARRLRLHRGLGRPAAGARRAPGLDLGRHQQHRRAGRAARDPPRRLAAGAADSTCAACSPRRRCTRGARGVRGTRWRAPLARAAARGRGRRAAATRWRARSARRCTT